MDLNEYLVHGHISKKDNAKLSSLFCVIYSYDKNLFKKLKKDYSDYLRTNNYILLFLVSNDDAYDILKNDPNGWDLIKYYIPKKYKYVSEFEDAIQLNFIKTPSDLDIFNV